MGGPRKLHKHHRHAGNIVCNQHIPKWKEDWMDNSSTWINIGEHYHVWPRTTTRIVDLMFLPVQSAMFFFAPTPLQIFWGGWPTNHPQTLYWHIGSPYSVDNWEVHRIPLARFNIDGSMSSLGRMAVKSSLLQIDVCKPNRGVQIFVFCRLHCCTIQLLVWLPIDEFFVSLLGSHIAVSTFLFGHIWMLWSIYIYLCWSCACVSTTVFLTMSSEA